MSSRMFLPGKTRSPSPPVSTRLRWPSGNEVLQDQRQSFEQMWEEIARGTRPCVCAVPIRRRQAAVQGTAASATAEATRRSQE